LFIHRIDGKLSNHRNKIYWDELIKIQNKFISNATIYQSNWSKRLWEADLKSPISEVIINEADPDLFKSNTRKHLSGRINLIFVSWSDNKNKGSEYLEWVIKERENYNLSLRIIGNLEVKNKKDSKFAVKHNEMQNLYKQSDIFLFPAKNEACSNALIEAQACGLPVLALNSGGNPELILDSGETFNDVQEMISGLNKIIKNYDDYSLAALKITNNRKSVQHYEEFIKSLLLNNQHINKVSKIKLIYASALILKLKIQIFIDYLK
jgi:glycosyltransferase involved in cell wall biosynthesis